MYGLKNIPVKAIEEEYVGLTYETGVKHTTAKSDKIKQLVFELGRAGVFTAKPVQNQQQDQGIISITVRMNGATATRAAPVQSTVGEYRLNMLMGKIKEVAQVQKWTR